MSVRKALRRARMGVEAAFGGVRSGFFIPYRYASGVPRPPNAPGYKAVEALFDAHAENFSDTLSLIDEAGPALAAIAGREENAPAPRFAQNWFPRLDAAAAYAIVAAKRPRRIVEVGSGHSTRFLARAARDAGAKTEILCLDPAPRAHLPEGAVHRAELLSHDHVPVFAALEPGDIAFFDSSHILYPHTDVDFIVTEMIPALRPGVLVHVHDIFLPDPYPEAWNWRGYAEQSALAPWLLSGGLTPIFASRYAATRMGAEARPSVRDLPETGEACSSSFWAVRRSA